jgi:predicted nucleic acid-binding protein
LRAFLGRHRRIGLDTSCFIYELEAVERYVALADDVFAWIQQPGAAAITSTITMTELLVQPYRFFDEKKIGETYSWLTTYPNLQWVAADLEIADTAARLRARYRLKTPDALHAATAVVSLATGFITNDAAFERVEEFETLLFDKLL